MPSNHHNEDTISAELPTADAQVARLVDIISSQFNGDTVGYFESVSHSSNADDLETRELEAQEKDCLASFVRCYR